MKINVVMIATILLRMRKGTNPCIMLVFIEYITTATTITTTSTTYY